MCTTVPTAPLPGQTLMKPAGKPDGPPAGWLLVRQPLVAPEGDAEADGGDVEAGGDADGDGEAGVRDLRGAADGDGEITTGEVCGRRCRETAVLA
jgi:hypothetical protein